MKKIIYLNYITTPELAIGVLKKLNYQTKILKELGVDMETIVFYMNGKAVNKFKHIEFHKVSVFPIFFHPPVRKIYGFFKKWRYIGRFLLQRSFDFILMRYPLADFTLVEFIRKYGNFIIFEHQTQEIPELNSLKSFNSFVKVRFEKRHGKRILEKVRGIIGVTPEIIHYELSRINTFKPHAVISNGINVEEISLSKRPFYDGRELSLLFVGTKNTPWHGIDRLLRGIALYKKTTPRINLHLVGNFTNKTKKMVNNLKIGDKVYFHGSIYGDEIDKIFDSIHIAIGTLALHRKQMKQACPLKVREYIARGIPFVIAYDDVDLEDNLSFYLKLRADESPINIEKIINWANNVLKNKNIPLYMREYALKKMDWKVKMKQLKDFLEKL